MPAGAEHRGREAVAVHAVGEELGLQGNGVAVAEDLAAVAFPGGQEVARVELHAGQIGEDLHADAGARRGKDSGLQSGQDIAVVVAAAVAELDIVRLNIPADGRWAGSEDRSRRNGPHGQSEDDPGRSLCLPD